MDATASGLTVTAAARGQAVVLAVAGEVDLASAPSLASALDQAETGGPPDLVVDLSGLEFIDLAGIRVLEHAADRCVRRGGRLTVESPHPRTLRILRLTGARLDLVAGIRGGELQA